MKKSISVFALFFAFTIIYAQGEKTPMEKVMGEKTLPAVTLADINGKNVNVAEYGKSGKITVLSFWATWCVPCKKELKNMS
jgi:thiol-disulfide isomerase/thioredoxin